MHLTFFTDINLQIGVCFCFHSILISEFSCIADYFTQMIPAFM